MNNVLVQASAYNANDILIYDQLRIGVEVCKSHLQQ